LFSARFESRLSSVTLSGFAASFRSSGSVTVRPTAKDWLVYVRALALAVGVGVVDEPPPQAEEASTRSEAARIADHPRPEARMNTDISAPKAGRDSTDDDAAPFV
jgi:hypothetical protein